MLRPMLLDLASLVAVDAASSDIEEKPRHVDGSHLCICTQRRWDMISSYAVHRTNLKVKRVLNLPVLAGSRRSESSYEPHSDYG